MPHKVTNLGVFFPVQCKILVVKTGIYAGLTEPLSDQHGNTHSKVAMRQCQILSVWVIHRSKVWCMRPLFSALGKYVYVYWLTLCVLPFLLIVLTMSEVKNAQAKSFPVLSSNAMCSRKLSSLTADFSRG